MPATRKPPKLRTRLTVLTTLLCVTALLVLGGALILVQARNSHASMLSEIEYAMQSTNASIRVQLAQITRIIRDLRNDPAFAPFWQGDAAGEEAAKARLAYSADLYSDQNLASGSEPFLTMAAAFCGENVISCAYFPTTQAESLLLRIRQKELCDAFLASGAERGVYPEGDQLYLLTRLYDLTMEPLGTVLFGISKLSLHNHYQALYKYDGALYALTDAKGALLAGEAAREKAYLTNRQALPFGLTAAAMVPEDQIVHLMYPALLSMTVTVMLLLPLIALIASAIAYHFSKPLRGVTEQIKRVEAGDYITKIDMPNWEEFQNIGARFNAMTDTIHHLVTEIYEKQLLAKESEIKFLQSQMNPHFMYNVLTMIAITAKRNGDEEAYRLLHSFSCLSRGRVFTGSQRMITLRQELELVDYYLFLQCKRYEDGITYQIDCDETLKDVLVPRLCIEPIAENAFLHGMEPKGTGNVLIRAEAIEGTLAVTVTDDGVGFEKDCQPEGVGIANTRKILQNMFGSSYGVVVKSKPGVGTRVIVTLPMNRDDTKKGGDAACGA